MDGIRAGRMAGWLVVLAAVVLCVIGVALLGPFGVLVALPALLLLLLLLAGSSGGPSAGA